MKYKVGDIIRTKETICDISWRAVRPYAIARITDVYLNNYGIKYIGTSPYDNSNINVLADIWIIGYHDEMKPEKEIKKHII